MQFLTPISPDTRRITDEFICGNCQLMMLARCQKDAVARGDRDTQFNLRDRIGTLEMLVMYLEEKDGEIGDGGQFIPLAPWATAVAHRPSCRMGSRPGFPNG